MTYIYTYTKRPYISTKPTKQNTHHSSTNKISPLRFVVLIQSHRCNSTGMFPSSVPLAVATASATAEAKAKSSSKDGSDDVGPATALEKKWSKRRISRSSGFFVTFFVGWLLVVDVSFLFASYGNLFLCKGVRFLLGGRTFQIQPSSSRKPLQHK